jgi:actin-like protein 6A
MTPGPVAAGAGESAAAATAGAGAGTGGPAAAKDLPGLVYEAMKASDVDVRKELLGNVLLTGAGSLFRGASERLQWELTERVPVAYKVKVVAATPIERRFSVWIGGSILASLGSFQQLWLSKAEYDEMGAERACQSRFH